MQRACFLLLAVWLGATATALGGDIRILTDPEGAEVWQGSVRLGTTGKEGLKLVGIEPGTVTYSIKMAGFQPVERTVSVESLTEALTVLVRLRPVASPGASEPAPSPAAAPVKASGTSAPDGNAEQAKGGGRGGHKGLLLGVAGGAVAVGVGVAALSGRTDPRDVDGDRDGFTSNQGDCNDSDSQVHPNGSFAISVTPDAAGAVNCNTPLTSISIRATNLDCSPVTVNSASWTSAHTSGATCFGGNFTVALTLTTTTVLGGSRDVVIASRGLGALAGCCSNGYCGSFDALCGWTETYTVNTSRGQFSQPNNYTITFPRGYSCQACATSAAAGKGTTGAGEHP